MTALLQKVSEWVHYSAWHISSNIGEHKVGVYKADYSALTDEQLAEEDFECVELLKHSRPVSR
jgi:hypothetical protein